MVLRQKRKNKRKAVRGDSSNRRQKRKVEDVQKKKDKKSARVFWDGDKSFYVRAYHPGPS